MKNQQCLVSKELGFQVMHFKFEIESGESDTAVGHKVL